MSPRLGVSKNLNVGAGGRGASPNPPLWEGSLGRCPKITCSMISDENSGQQLCNKYRTHDCRMLWCRRGILQGGIRYLGDRCSFLEGFGCVLTIRGGLWACTIDGARKGGRKSVAGGWYVGGFRALQNEQQDEDSKSTQNCQIVANQVWNSLILQTWCSILSQPCYNNTLLHRLSCLKFRVHSGSFLLWMHSESHFQVGLRGSKLYPFACCLLGNDYCAESCCIYGPWIAQIGKSNMNHGHLLCNAEKTPKDGLSWCTRIAKPSLRSPANLKNSLRQRANCGSPRALASRGFHGTTNQRQGLWLTHKCPLQNHTKNVSHHSHHGLHIV